MFYLEHESKKQKGDYMKIENNKCANCAHAKNITYPIQPFNLLALYVSCEKNGTVLCKEDTIKKANLTNLTPSFFPFSCEFYEFRENDWFLINQGHYEIR